MQINIKEKKIEDGRFGFFGPTTMLLSPFAKILSGILLVGLLSSLGFSAYKVLQTKDLEIKLLEEKQNTQHLSTELDQCKLELESYNLQIDRIRKDAENDINAIKRVNEELNKLTVEQRREIEKLLNAPAPVGCEGSTQWLKDNLDIFER